MEPYQWWWHGCGFMWIFPLLFLIVMVLFLFRGPWWTGRGHGHGEARELRARSSTGGLPVAKSAKSSTRDMKRTLAG